MKYNLTGNTFVTDSENKTKSFSLDANAKAFSIITSGIYKNPIKAINRELSTNAVDSQKEAGVKTKFEVWLPTDKDATYSIRDYGTGLSPYVLENVYFKAFASTKDQSNEYTGSLGIGRLSVLAYNTQSFTVESFYNGQHLIYQCFIGKDGIPDYNKVFEEETDEPNGLKISFACKRTDVIEFNKAAADTYQWFSDEDKPIVHNINNYYYYTMNTITKVTDLYSRTSNYNGISYALMGNIAYPIENDPQLDKYQHLNRKGLVLPFEIGEVDFTGSREALRYTKQTVNSIIGRYEAIIADLKKQLSDKVDQANSEWQAYIEYEKYSSMLNIFQSTNSDFEYKGKKYKFWIDYKKENCLLNYRYKKRFQDIDKFNPSARLQIVINDIKIGAKSRAALYAEENNKDILLIEEDDIATFPLKLETSDYIRASTLNPVTRIANTGKRVHSFMEIKDEYYVSNCLVKSDPSTITKDKYYVIRKAYKIVKEEAGQTYEYSPKDIIKLAKQAKIEKVYAISKSEEDNIISLGFTNFFDSYESLMKKRLDSITNQLPFLSEYVSKVQFINSTDYFITNIKRIKRAFPSEIGTYFDEILDINDYVEKNANKYKSLIEEKDLLSKYKNIDIPGQVLDSKYKKLVDRFYFVKNYHSENKTTTQHLLYYVLGVIANG